MNERYKPHTYEGEHEKAREGFEKLETDNDIQKQKYLDQYLSTEDVGSDYEHAKKVLDEINEPLLIDIFKREIGKAGRDVNDTNFRPISETNIRTLISKYGAYNALSNEIELAENFADDTKELEKLSAELGISRENYLKLNLLHIFTHEETHAVGQNNHSETVVLNPDLSESKIVQFKSGVSRLTKIVETDSKNRTQTSEFDGYESINEGLTELIAQRVLSEYLKQDPPRGVSSKDTEEFLKLIKTFDGNAYAGHLYAVKLFAVLISKATDVPAETVEDALVRGYLRGSDFITDEMVEMMDELLGKDMGEFLRLSASQNSFDFQRAIMQADIKIDIDTYLKLGNELLVEDRAA